MIWLIAVIAAYLLLRARGCQRWDAACWALAAGLFLSGIDHLLYSQWYVSLMAPWLPAKALLVYVSAALRMGLACGLLPRAPRRGVLIGVMALLLVVLQVNLRVAVLGDQLEGARQMAPWWRWARVALHAGWLAWTAACLRAAFRPHCPEAAHSEGDSVS